METVMAQLTGEGDQSKFADAADILLNGGLVAFPTETVYGLGADATNEEAVRDIYRAKGRPSDNPLIVHIGTAGELERYAEDVPETAKKCAEAFWPGPLTLIVTAKPGVFAPSVTAGLDTVGLRMPDHPAALGLLRASGLPVAAPSANTSGKPSPTHAEHVAADMGGKIPYILDGGATGIGIESTVLDLTSRPPAILRPGAVTADMLRPVIGEVNHSAEAADAGENAPRSPGMKYTHYSPEAPVWMIGPDAGRIINAVSQLHSEGKKVALVAPEGFGASGADWYFPTGRLNDPVSVSAELYASLRACDGTDADIVLAVTVDDDGIGGAVMNRLNKAAGGRRYPG
ncbi:L-threonylcarbamoyladenylate synthase [Bhargavaea ginsengi]|uniref:L-threonylcarbamoyladenylate synthase n=1 Tax=Bhargavaea ginsengi TaxID=426757 RepID=UPI00203D6CBE|nr:L-threonylcarbamoyladenylate synthase [Bhargavaea ginsengi]MCM3087182.1 L-threonylcarbamoyladenylate synthase [Bhargavaea ginsengi]